MYDLSTFSWIPLRDELELSENNIDCEIVVFDKIWATAGWLVADIVYLLAILLMCSAVYYISYGFRCLRAKRLAKAGETTQESGAIEEKKEETITPQENEVSAVQETKTE